MGVLDDLLKKAPHSVNDKYKIKIREKAIERVKEKIIKLNKSKYKIPKLIEPSDTPKKPYLNPSII